MILALVRLTPLTGFKARHEPRPEFVLSPNEGMDETPALSSESRVKRASLLYSTRANCIRQTIIFSEREVSIMTHEQLTASVAIAYWKIAVARTDKVFSELTEEQF